MFLEPFSAEMKCPICNRKTPHLIELDSIHFQTKTILFYAYCSSCDKTSFMLNGIPSQPFLYKCDYEYWDQIEPLEDKPNLN